MAREAGCSPVVVVLGAECAHVLRNSSLEDAVTVVNDQWKGGMGSSIRLGVRTLEVAGKDVDGVVLMTCDQPAVTAQHLRLIAAEEEVNASQYACRKGVPAYFPAKCFDMLLALRGDVGARELLVDAPSENLMDGELDVDTLDDLQRARVLFG